MSSKVSNFFRWSKNILTYNGWGILCWRILQRSLKAIGRLEVVTFFERDLTQPLNDLIFREKVNFSITALSDVPTLVRLMNERQKIRLDDTKIEFNKLVLSRFERGSLCFSGKINSEIIHYNWVSFNSEESLGGRFVHLNPDEAFCLDAFTVREWRGKGVYPAAQAWMLRTLQEKGIGKAYTLIDADNSSSRKPHTRQGWKPIGTVLCFTPTGASRGFIWRLKGNLSRFLEKRNPAAGE
jgi:RimJ/RimL family protein N-acetyltransferase